MLMGRSTHRAEVPEPVAPRHQMCGGIVVRASKTNQEGVGEDVRHSSMDGGQVEGQAEAEGQSVGQARAPRRSRHQSSSLSTELLGRVSRDVTMLLARSIFHRSARDVRQRREARHTHRALSLNMAIMHEAEQTPSYSCQF